MGEAKVSTGLRGYRRPAAGTQPNYLYPPYKSSLKKAPTKPLVLLPHTLSEITGPVFGHDTVSSNEFDLTAQHAGEPQGQRIIVTGRVMDEDERPVPETLIEIWQANAGGRYRHRVDDHNAPLDPNFTGCGRSMTDEEGRYRFVTIRPGAYPWRNHYNAWRPAHIHFSLFGSAFVTRLVTQMYFPGDPLIPFDPILQGVPDEAGRLRLISEFDWDNTIPEQVLGFRFDIILRGRNATPMEK